MKEKSNNIRKILIFGVKPHWEFVSLPTNNLANYLEKKGSNEIFYISDDLSFFHFFKWKFSFSLMNKFISIILKSINDGNITYLSAFSLFPNFSNISSIYDFLFLKLNFRFRSKKMKTVLSKNFDLVFCSSYRNYREFLKVKAKRKIFSIEDNPSGFGILSEEFILKADKLIGEDSSIERWCTSKSLIRERFPDAQYYTNGINSNFKIKLNFNKNKKCIYVGALDNWFDWELVNESFEQIGDDLGFKLDIYGFSNTNVSKNIKSKYIEYKGPIKNVLLQNVLSKYSVGIIPFSKNDLIDYVNPIKFYEYLSTGLRTVSTSWKEIEELDYPYIYLSEREKFASNIVKANEETFKGHEKQIEYFLKTKTYNYIFEEKIKI